MEDISIPDWVINLGLGILGGIIVAVICALIGRFYKKRRAPKPGVITPEGPRDLDDPKYLLGIRADEKFGFNPYYHPREYLDDEIYKRINTFKSLLVIGAPLAGKTRAVYEALRKFNPKPFVTMPSIQDVQDENYPDVENIPTAKRAILLFDDIHKYTVRDSMAQLLLRYKDKGAIIIATCRKGPEYDRLCDSMKDCIGIFGDPIEIEKFERDDAEAVAKETNRDVPDTFDGTIGSLFVPLQEIEERYGLTAVEGKKLLQSIKSLYDAGVYDEDEVFAIDHIGRVYTNIEEMTATEDEWQVVLRRLEQKGFYRISGDAIQIEETYLQNIIPGSFNDPDDLLAISKLFNDDFDSLYKIMATAYRRGLLDVRKAAYMKLTITICRQCFELQHLKETSRDYTNTLVYLGLAYGGLADVEDKAANCRAAIEAYEKALKIYTLDSFPKDYAMTQNNLGIAYQTLAEVEDKAANCRAAISAYENALKMRTLESFPMQYAATQNNLGTAYSTLAEVEDKASNCRAAIEAYEKALKVFAFDRFPMDYAMTQNNLGNAYGTLAQVKDKADNCRAAISAFEKALKVYNLDSFPMDYAMTQNNLAGAYIILASEEEFSSNCALAVEACENAMKVYTREQFPMQFADSQIIMGAIYYKLALIENKSDNCSKARQAHNTALEIYTKENNPERYKMIMHNLAVLENTCKD